MNDPVEIVVVGDNEGITPVLESWDWTVAGYLFLGGLVGGLMILGGFFILRRVKGFDRAVRIVDFAGLPLLSVGLLLLFADLSNKQNAWRFFTTFQITSPMSWGSWILAAAGLLLALRFVRHHTMLPWFPKLLAKWINRITAWTDRITMPMAVATMAVGVALALYTGFLLSTITARPLWDSALLPPLFLTSGIASAGAFLCLWLAPAAHRKLAPFSVAVCIVELVLLFWYIASLESAGADQAVTLLTTGGFAFWFWTLVVVGGLLVPLGIETGELRKWLTHRVARVAPYFKLVGAASLRFVVLFAGLESFL